jgi:two-component system sensor histidine kinase ResE
MMAEDKNIKLIVKNSPVPIYAKGNIDRICEVLTILIDNALKFARDGSTVTLSARKENGRAKVSIHNTGSIIKREDLPFIFERFYKADKAHAGEGAGLGLSIAKEVIMRMNGNIYVKSDEIDDTCFIFELESGA